MIKNVIIFTVGASVGAGATYLFLDKKYKKEYSEKKKAVEEFYKAKANSEASKSKPSIDSLIQKKEPEKTDISTDRSEYGLSKWMKDLDKTSKEFTDNALTEVFAKEREEKAEESHDFDKEFFDDLMNKTDEEGDEEDMNTTDAGYPHEITFNEYSVMNGYSKSTLTYYKDDILADENDEIMDTEYTVGYENIDILPDYDDASVYVRNDHLGADYEIVRDDRTYSEVTGIFVHDYNDDSDD